MSYDHMAILYSTGFEDDEREVTSYSIEVVMVHLKYVCRVQDDEVLIFKNILPESRRRYPLIAIDICDTDLIGNIFREAVERVAWVALSKEDTIMAHYNGQRMAFPVLRGLVIGNSCEG